ncbi:TPA: hypothetical protein ACOVFI_004726 [Citrobacter braakii]
MGNRTFLFVHDAKLKEISLEHCVAETNNRFALEWFAWIPQGILENHISILRRTVNSDGEDGDPIRHELTTICVPWAQAIACFRESLFRILRTHPTLAPALRDLFMVVEEHARRYIDPVITMECIQMANFTDVNGYLQDVQAHHAFWLQRTPWEDVSFSTELENELTTIPSRHPIKPRWRDRHENAVSWMLSMLAAAAFFAVYMMNGSWFLGGAIFIATAVGLTLLVFHWPQAKPLARKMQSSALPRALSVPLFALVDNPVFGVALHWQEKSWFPVEDAIPDWDDKTVTVLLSCKGRTRYLWNDIKVIGYDVGGDGALLGNIELTDTAKESGRYENVDRPLWFAFDSRMDAHLTVLVLRLLHRVNRAAGRVPQGQVMRRLNSIIRDGADTERD